ncbi:unnamed protein product [Sphagnum jensenii]|uniref:Thaumatin-like protein n=1 Tax=Sphagnum jensenii TaxID=128206 RepID=A0ABP1BZ84_9BRYO
MIWSMSFERPLHANLLESLALEFFNDGTLVFNSTHQCPYNIIVCYNDSAGVSAAYNAGVALEIPDPQVTLASAQIWGYPGSNASLSDCISAKLQADLAEFTINSSNNTDFYLISNVNAYNFGLTINPQGNYSCPAPSCAIPNITNFCQAPNTLTGPLGDGCYNTDGPNATSPTPGTMAFANACPDAVSYLTDVSGKVFACPTGSNYEVVFSCS